MEKSIVPLKISQLAKLIAQNKHISVLSALNYIYDSPFYEKLYDANAKWWYLDTQSLYREIERSKGDGVVSDNTITFVTFCMERYALKHGLTSLQAYALFRRYNVDAYLIDGFDVLHTQGEDAILQDIEIYMKNRR